MNFICRIKNDATAVLSKRGCPHSIDKRSLLLSAVLLIIYIALRLRFFLNSDIATAFDTLTYDGTSIGWCVECGTSFWTGIRPPVVPLMFRVFHNNFSTIALFQFVLSTFSWICLTVSAAACIKTRVWRFILFTSLLGFSLTSHIIYWDRAMLSESLAFSVQALIIATAFLILRGWTRRRCVLLLSLSLVWCFIRDTNLWYILMVALAMLPFAVQKAARMRIALISAAFMSFFVLGDQLATRSLRWTGNFYNVLTSRILLNTNHVRFFEERGMPITPELMLLAGKLHIKEMHSDESFAPLRDWTFSEGKKLYTHFLLSHPEYLVTQSLHEMPDLLGQKKYVDSLFGQWHFTPALPDTLDKVLFGEPFTMLWVYLAPFLIGIAIPFALRDTSAILFLPIGLVALSYPHAMLTWLGDVMEISRHAFGPTIQFRLGLLLLSIYLLDYITRPRAPSIDLHET